MMKVKIGSGLTKIRREDGFEYLLGIHKAPYLENSKHALLSTAQVQEAGTFIKEKAL